MPWRPELSRPRIRTWGPETGPRRPARCGTSVWATGGSAAPPPRVHRHATRDSVGSLKRPVWTSPSLSRGNASNGLYRSCSDASSKARANCAGPDSVTLGEGPHAVWQPWAPDGPIGPSIHPRRRGARLSAASREEKPGSRRTPRPGQAFTWTWLGTAIRSPRPLRPWGKRRRRGVPKRL
jgi:hypothetical protein